MEQLSPSSALYELQVTRVVLNATDPHQVSYLLFVSATYRGAGGEWDINPVNFQIMTNDSHLYYCCTGYTTGDTLLQSATLTQGKSSEWQLAFDVTRGEAPAVLGYNLDGAQDDFAANINVSAPVPAVSSWVSSLGPAATVQLVSGQGASQTIFATAQISGDQRYFYSGEKVNLTITVRDDGPGSAGAAREFLTSVTDDDGITILSTKPAIPVPVPNGADSVLLKVVLVAPSRSLTEDSLDIALGISTNP